MRQLSRFEQLAVLDERKPVRNVVVHRTLPFTIGVAAVQTASGLCAGVGTVVGTVDFVVVANTLFGVFLFGVLARHLEELQRVLRHYAALRSASMSEPSSAAFGFTTQNFGR